MKAPHAAGLKLVYAFQVDIATYAAEFKFLELI